MEFLSPSHPPGPNGDQFFRASVSPPANVRQGDQRTLNSHSPEDSEEGFDKVYVAVGKSMTKAVDLLHWSFERFGNREICILHVHQPSPTIPTLLGKLPVRQANDEVVSAYRREEREQMKKLLLNYLTICFRSKVRACTITTEADQVQKGIVDLVHEHGIRKLVMEAVPENWMKVKKISSKASYVAQNAPSFCQIWFVNKHKLVWVREASESPGSVPPISQADSDTSRVSRSQSLRHQKSEVLLCNPEFLRSSSTRSVLSAGTRSWDHMEDVFPFAEQRVASVSDPKAEEESLYSQLAEVKIEVEESRNEAFEEVLRRKNLEAEAVDAISKVKAFEAAQAREVELREEAGNALRSTIEEQEKLLEEREAVMKQLQKAMRNIALLDSRAIEANRRCEEAAGELRLVQASIATLRQEKQKIQRQKVEAMRWLDRWKNHGQDEGEIYNGFGGFSEDSTKVAEFLLSDLQTATCDFSECFKIGQGGHGCVYKGEMLDRTVAIKQLHPRTMQGQSEFQLEVQVLGKIQHPHLVTLIGVCPEAWSVIYEYLPNGNLQDRLFRRSNIHSLNWKTRARIIAEIASALLLLHSKPKNTVHGNLKPENILLDSELSCKISDFGISRLVSKETLRCPSFRQYTEPKGAFPYTDPEFRRTGLLTAKSDIYSFGLIILQLLTGRSPAGLAIEVRKAVSCEKLSHMLDSSAGEWPTFIANRLVEVGLQCCELNSKDRPEITPSLVRELEKLHVLEEQPVPSFFLCPIRQDIMHDPQVAADGFTYEGEALRGWLENGRDTSPMTNLKLEHLHLTPNHALRLAIQEWLCKS
ncbi:hypothetical protein LguiA_020966 [Lonicera macranthoides]